MNPMKPRDISVRLTEVELQAVLAAVKHSIHHKLVPEDRAQLIRAERKLEAAEAAFVLKTPYPTKARP